MGELCSEVGFFEVIGGRDVALRGRFPLDIRITGVRSLTREDLGRLREPRFVHPTKRLRQSHHQLALLEAMGHTTQEISKLTGYSDTRISTLRNDPAFKMIVDEKRKVINDAMTKEAGDAMALKFRIMAASDRHILDQIDALDEAGELMPLKTALAISADMADRVGFAKHSTSTSYDGDWAKKMEDRIAIKSKLVEVVGLERPAIPSETKSLRPPQAVSAGPPKRSGSESPSPGAQLRLVHGITRR